MVEKQTRNDNISCPKFVSPPELQQLVMARIMQAENNKSPGPDGISNEMLKLLPNDFSKLLAQLWIRMGM